jgi:hypothetical protein
MNMQTQSEISLPADQELDAVVGGRMKLPSVDQPPPPRGGLFSSPVSPEGGLVAGLGAVVGMVIGGLIFG